MREKRSYEVDALLQPLLGALTAWQGQGCAWKHSWGRLQGEWQQKSQGTVAASSLRYRPNVH